MHTPGMSAVCPRSISVTPHTTVVSIISAVLKISSCLPYRNGSFVASWLVFGVRCAMVSFGGEEKKKVVMY